jgi:hypothetical protein
MGGQSSRFKESENLKTQRRIRGILKIEKQDNSEKDQGYSKNGN